MPSASSWQACAVPIPDDMPAAEAVSLFGVVYGTAWHALHNRAALQPGETVLVHAAAGGVGSAAVQLAAAHGCRVLATAGGPAKTAFAPRLGAELALDYDAPAIGSTRSAPDAGPRRRRDLSTRSAATSASAACAAWPGMAVTWWSGSPPGRSPHLRPTGCC